MKIRFKLISSIILALVIPVIIISHLLTKNYAKMICETEMYSLSNLNTTKAAYVKDYFDNITTSLKSFTSDAAVRSFTAASLSDEEEDSAENSEDYQNYIKDKIKTEMDKSPSLVELIITNDTGLVLAADNASYVGSKLEDFSVISAYATDHNGISPVYAPAKGNPCYIYAVRRIYSPKNLKVGFIIKKISLDELCEQLKVIGYSNYASTMIIDSNGQYITNSVSTPKSLESVAEYRPISEHLANVIPFYNETASQNETLSAEFDSYYAVGTVISGADWCFASTYDIEAAKSYKSFKFNSSFAYIILFTCLGAAAVIVICMKYTDSILRIITVINKQNKGDKDARLELKSNDEFGEISSVFNTLLDDISASDKRYHAIISMSDNVVFEVDLKKFTVYTSNNFNQKFSFRAKDSTINESFLYKIKIHKDDTKKYLHDLDHIVSSVGEKWEGEYRFKNIYGDFSWIRVKSVKIMDRRGNPEKIIGTLTDIDREKKSAINLMQKANYDALTQLYNRASFLRTLDEEIQASVQRRSLDALMFIDLDDFKHFNDEFGHKCGDEVLKFVADTIKEITFDKGFGGRLGGDEFVMCLTNMKLIGDAGKAAAEVISILDQGFISESCGEKFNIHCSIGIAFFRENGNNSTELLESADAAMYKIKKSGKSNYAYFGIDPDTASSPVNSIHPKEATFDNTFLR